MTEAKILVNWYNVSEAKQDGEMFKFSLSSNTVTAVIRGDDPLHFHLGGNITHSLQFSKMGKNFDGAKTIVFASKDGKIVSWQDGKETTVRPGDSFELGTEYATVKLTVY